MNWRKKIYCESGFYNKTLEIGQFEKNAILKQDQQSLQADSIYFDKRSSISEAFEDVVLIDEQEHLKVSGDYGFFNQNDNFSFITKKCGFCTRRKQ